MSWVKILRWKMSVIGHDHGKREHFGNCKSPEYLEEETKEKGKEWKEVRINEGE